MKDYEEIVAAFVDDERVDADTLERALALPEARRYLTELLAVRELVVDRTNEMLAQAPVGGTTMSRTTKAWLAAAAAVLIAAAGLAGFGVGQRLRDRAPQSVAQPVAAPKPAGPENAGLIPPAPTRVIRLEAGKDWQERPGGE